MNDKEAMLASLAKESDMVVATAYMYAVNMSKFGTDVTEKWLTAVQQASALNGAYVRGRIDSDKEWASHGTPLKRCKDCKHFETDVVATCDGIPLIIGHECCTKWGDGCKTKEDGYCFMFEAKEVDDVRKSD